jgi:hypothetical protein
MQSRVLKLTEEFGDKDVKIRKLSAKFNSYLMKANNAAVEKLVAAGYALDKVQDMHDEL